MAMPTPSAVFWRGKRVLLTGHTGFKGAWLALWLQRLGAHVTGVGLAPLTTPNLFDLLGGGASAGALCAHHHVCDVRDAVGIKTIVANAKPDVVLHLAAQALVRASYTAPLETWSTNVMGTAHLLDALRGVAPVRVAVVVTTDKVYQNTESATPYCETDALGGHDPYSASKGACELLVASYAASFLIAQGVRVSTARAGNVIGGGDWSADRLLPDAVRAWSTGQALDIRRPHAVRPWQHVLEPLSAYLVLAERMWSSEPAHRAAASAPQPDAPQPAEICGAYNFGPDANESASVRQVVLMAQAAYGRGAVTFDESATQGPHEAGLLALDTRKARAMLGIRSRWGLGQAVQRSMAWYRAQAQGADARSLCLADIAAFEGAAGLVP